MWDFWYIDHEDASALVALVCTRLQHRGQEGCGIVSLMEKLITIKTRSCW